MMQLPTHKPHPTKKGLLLFFSLLFLMSSCNVSKNITYFQDIQDGQTASNEQPRPEIRLRPEDKISIIVNTKVPELTALFNLPYTTRILGQTQEQVTNTNQGTSGYIIKADGNIDFPVLGMVKAAGLTRDELAAHIKSELIDRNLVNEPVVTVEFVNLQFAVMGEVKAPGSYKITRDHITLLDALSMAGDLNINGRRDNVLVLRPDAQGKLTAYKVDMRSFDDVKNSQCIISTRTTTSTWSPTRNALTNRPSTPTPSSRLPSGFRWSRCWPRWPRPSRCSLPEANSHAPGHLLKSNPNQYPLF